MASEEPRQNVKEELTTNIQLGIYVPGQVMTPKEWKVGSAGNVGKENQVARKRSKRSLSADYSVDGSELQTTRIKKQKVSFSVAKEESPPREVEEMDKTEREKVSDGKKRKRLKKGRRRLGGKANSSTAAKTHADRGMALDYLRQWDTDIASWTFRKKTQYWLLQNACDKSQIPKADFKILLRYIEGLQGNQRQVMAAKARGIVDSHCQSQDIENLTSHKRVHKRALEILKILS